MKGRRFVALDRDGTLIVERHYLSDPRQVELVPGAARALKEMQEMGLGLVVLTNQSGIGRGFFDEACLELIHRRLRELLGAEGVYLEGIYYCPHTPEEGCLCRKPQPGLIQEAAGELGFAPEASFVIGDQACDVELGKRVGATTLLVRTGYGAGADSDDDARPDYVVDDLVEAARVIHRILGAE